MGNVVQSLDDHVSYKRTERGDAQEGTLRFAASAMKGHRNSMEDCHTLCDAIPVEGCEESLTNHSLFAVYDGHGGSFTSAYAGERFVGIFSQRQEWKKYVGLPRNGGKSRTDVTGVHLIKSALKRTFFQLDVELRTLQTERNDFVLRQAGCTLPNQQVVRLERSGSTCLVVVITPSHIICANAGDSRAILRRRGRVLPLSFDHKPTNVLELERIVDAGGFVRGRRVDGDLAVSRGLGDFSFKNNPKISLLKQKVICEPDIVVYPRNNATDEFLVLACDGVWDVATNEQCATMVQDMLDEGETRVDLVCEEILDMCLERNSRDNMSLIMVGFPGLNISHDRSLAGNVVSARRTARQARMVKAEAQFVAKAAASGLGLNGASPADTVQKSTKSGCLASSNVKATTVT